MNDSNDDDGNENEYNDDPLSLQGSVGAYVYGLCAQTMTQYPIYILVILDLKRVPMSNAYSKFLISRLV